jgi:hypothetical protein
LSNDRDTIIHKVYVSGEFSQASTLTAHHRFDPNCMRDVLSDPHHTGRDMKFIQTRVGYCRVLDVAT